jgi:hypothetical protein
MRQCDSRTRAGSPGLPFHDLWRSGVRNMKRAGILDRMAIEIRAIARVPFSTGTTSLTWRIIRTQADGSKSMPGRESRARGTSPARQVESSRLASYFSPLESSS